MQECAAFSGPYFTLLAKARLALRVPSGWLGNAGATISCQ